MDSVTGIASQTSARPGEEVSHAEAQSPRLNPSLARPAHRSGGSLIPAAVSLLSRMSGDRGRSVSVAMKKYPLVAK